MYGLEEIIRMNNKNQTDLKAKVARRLNKLEFKDVDAGVIKKNHGKLGGSAEIVYKWTHSATKKPR